MSVYYEPVLQPLTQMTDPLRFQNSNLGFEYLNIHERGRAPEMIHIMDCDEDVFEVFTNTPQLTKERSRFVMGIVNVTPDSFSDGGQFFDHEAAVRHAQALVIAGADILDFGAESTRPGSDTVPAHEELRRLEAVLEMLEDFGVPTSIDTRKSAVADAAIASGVAMINDVSAGTFDPELLEIVAQSGVNICLMHAQGDPKTMQDEPEYDDVLLDIFDFLKARVEFAESLGIERSRIVLDPGIGFGKTLEHNLRILKHVAIYHALGCPLLVGASRKRLISAISPSEPEERLGGSLSIALDLARKGVQFIRVHDVLETAQALKIQDRLLME